MAKQRRKRKARFPAQDTPVQTILHALHCEIEEVPKPVDAATLINCQSDTQATVQAAQAGTVNDLLTRHSEASSVELHLRWGKPRRWTTWVGLAVGCYSLAYVSFCLLQPWGPEARAIGADASGLLGCGGGAVITLIAGLRVKDR